MTLGLVIPKCERTLSSSTMATSAHCFLASSTDSPSFSSTIMRPLSGALRPELLPKNLPSWSFLKLTIKRLGICADRVRGNKRMSTNKRVTIFPSLERSIAIVTFKSRASVPAHYSGVLDGYTRGQIDLKNAKWPLYRGHLIESLNFILQRVII